MNQSQYATCSSAENTKSWWHIPSIHFTQIHKGWPPQSSSSPKWEGGVKDEAFLSQEGSTFGSTLIQALGPSACHVKIYLLFTLFGTNCQIPEIEIL